MMILKHGKFYKEPIVHTVTCSNCDCVFTYETKDVKQHWKRINSEDSDRIYDYVKCPECEYIIKVKEYGK